MRSNQPACPPQADSNPAPLKPLKTFWVAVASLVVAGCCAGPCDIENFPSQGVARDGEALHAIVRHAANNECWSELYDFLSARTRDEHSYIKMRPFISGWRAQEPWEYRVVDILAKGELIGVWPDGPQGAELLMLTYREPGRPELLAQLLIVEEPDEETGLQVKRLGLQEQYEHGPALNQAPPEGSGE